MDTDNRPQNLRQIEIGASQNCQTKRLERSRKLEWLDLMDEGFAKAPKGTEVIDIEDIVGERTCAVDERGHLYLAVCVTVVRMTL